jgi:hypothetical protein
MILPVALPGESSANPKVRTNAAPDLRMLRSQPYPVGLLAYALLQTERTLRDMCFIDNEYGKVDQDNIDNAGLRSAAIVNGMLARQARQVRVVSVSPWSKRHHHIQVQWATLERVETEDGASIVMQMQPTLIANLYTPSKRPQEGEDEEERVGPRRGEKLKKKRRNSKAVLIGDRRRRSEAAEESSSSSEGDEADVEIPTERVENNPNRPLAVA